MTEAQIQLQNALTTTFLANLAFSSEYDNGLYHRIDELSRMIENGTYKEKYALEFIMENGDFDIYDIVNDKYLYDKVPKKINDNMVKEIEFNEKNSILNIQEHFIFKKQFPIDRNARFNFENINQCSSLTLNDTFEYSNALEDFLDAKKKKLKKIEKFIFIGTLLGRHIPRIAEKIDAEAYLVLERNLEVFRLSLFTVDYTIVAKKGAIFSIMDSPRDEEKKIYDFLHFSQFDNYLLKISTTNINIDTYIDTILSIVNILDPIGYDYNRYLYTYINRTTKNIDSEYKTLLFNKINEKCNIFKNIPILYLAAGPSLDENIEWIKENQNKFFIVTIGAACKKILLNDIRVDMITTLDEQYTILNDKQFDDETVSKIGDNTIILASEITNENILKKFNQDNLFLYEVFIPFHKNNLVFDGYSIGEITLAMLIKMNPKDIYLIGLDLALNQKTGDSHFNQSNSGVLKLNLKEKQNREYFEQRKSLIKVKGNFKKEVFTTPLFYTSIKSAESKIFLKNKDTNIFNLSTHGAYFFATKPKKIRNIKINEFVDSAYSSEIFKDFLIKNSSKELSIESKKKLQKDLIFIEELNKILEEIEIKDFKTYNSFLKKIYFISKKMINKKIFIFYQVINNYFEIVIPYLSYHFNDKEIKNQAKEIKKIKNIFINDVKRMAEDYKTCLERVIK
jgi:hypothetical protein